MGLTLRNEANLKALVVTLERNCGDFFAACKACGLSPSSVRKWCIDDAIVAEQLDEAERVGALAIQSEVIRRGVRGVEEDVYYKGDVCGTKRVYSDGLLTLLAKKRLKDMFGDDPAQTNVQVNVNNNLRQFERPSTYEEWLLLTNINHALPSPDLDYTDFEAVLPPPELDPAMADIL